MVLYDPALPAPEKKPAKVPDLIKAQEDAAMTMYVYHLNGIHHTYSTVHSVGGRNAAWVLYQEYIKKVSNNTMKK